MTKSDILYVSPHADDVAFSAAGQVARDVAAGHRVRLLTLFETPQGPGPFSDHRARVTEDEAFAGQMKMERTTGGFLDAIARDPRFRSPDRVFRPYDEHALVDEIAAQLQAFVDGGCKQVVAPLGIGGHVDHQIAHAASRKVRGAELVFLRRHALRADAPSTAAPTACAGLSHCAAGFACSPR